MMEVTSYTSYHIGYGENGQFVEKPIIKKAIATWDRQLVSGTDIWESFTPSNYNNMLWPEISLSDGPWTDPEPRGVHYEWETLSIVNDEYQVYVWYANSYNPLSFNEYSYEDWTEGYHYTSDNWNVSYSPFAYCNNVNSSSANRQLTVKRTIESRVIVDTSSVFYKNRKSLSIRDSEGQYSTFSSYVSQENQFNDYIGAAWFVGDDTVTSENKNAYPDGGSYDDFFYILDKAATKFLEYYKDDSVRTGAVLSEDRYAYTHDDQFTPDHSYDNTVVGTEDSTNEDAIPDAFWTRYMGIYEGTSLPELGITEVCIPPSDILGVPAYNKQVNTSDTLKYGTVGTASLTFTMNKPVAEAMAWNNSLLVLFYDFTHTNNWERLGFFYIDEINALDEFTTEITAHDEAVKLNKYVDDFLETYSHSTTLDGFYRDLLDYCDCCYDTQEGTIKNGSYALNNVYHAVKTTGTEVIHYVANLSPGFIHANRDGDIKLEQYHNTNTVLLTSEYSNLTYNAYNAELLNKVRITNGNTILGEDSGTGENIYFIKDNPLIGTSDGSVRVGALATSILNEYQLIPTYRPAQITFLVLPNADIGDAVSVVTKGGQTYNIVIQRLSINNSGVEMESFGTATYPVEADTNSEFTNLSSQIDSITTDVSNIGDTIINVEGDISDVQDVVNELVGDMNTLNTNQQNLANTINNDIGPRLTDAEADILSLQATQIAFNNSGVSSANNLGTVNLNGTLDNIALKGYVDNSISTATTNINADKVVFKTCSILISYNSILYEANDCFFMGNSAITYGIITMPTGAVSSYHTVSAGTFTIIDGKALVLYIDGNKVTYYPVTIIID